MSQITGTRKNHATALSISAPSGVLPLVRTSLSDGINTADMAREIYISVMGDLDDDVKRSLDSKAEPPSIRIGASQECCSEVFLRVLACFVDDHPHLSFQIFSDATQELSEGVTSIVKSVDLAFLQRTKSHIDGKVLWTEKLSWLAREDLRVSMNEAIPLVLRGSRIPARYEVIKALMLSEIKWQIRFESNDQSSLVSALHAGLGIGAGFRRLKAHVGLNRLPQQIKLPELPEIDVVMVGPGLASSAILRAVTLFLEKAATLSHHAEVLELYPTH